MGGRGGSSGIGGRSFQALMRDWNRESAKGADWQYTGDYNDDGNQNLIKYQGQDDDKTGNFLHGTENNINFSDYDDGYEYHDIPLNKLLLRLGIKGKPTELSDADFDKYIQQTGQQEFYRGWSSKSSADRMLDAKNNHVGNGRYGDGYYFTPDYGTAQSYASFGSGVVQRVALSPKARVISLSRLRQQMRGMSSKLQSSLNHTGNGGSGRTYSGNRGEAQAALKLGYNVIDVGSGFYVAVTRDAFVVSRRYR